MTKQETPKEKDEQPWSKQADDLYEGGYINAHQANQMPPDPAEAATPAPAVEIVPNALNEPEQPQEELPLDKAA